MDKERQEERIDRRKYWSERVRQWSNSGLTQKEYCEREGLSVERLGTWKRRLDREAKARGEIVAVPSDIVSSVLFAARGLGLVVNERYRLEIPDRFSPSTLESVLQVLNRL